MWSHSGEKKREVCDPTSLTLFSNIVDMNDGVTWSNSLKIKPNTCVCALVEAGGDMISMTQLLVDVNVSTHLQNFM